LVTWELTNYCTLSPALDLCKTQTIPDHHTLKVYVVSGGKGPHILDFGTG